jgi:outer membrane protein OmpA-like peptidoglycan-associated protein
MERLATLKNLSARGRRPGPARPVGLAAGFLAVSLGLGGCTALDSLFQGEPVQNERVVADVDPEQQAYPNLASVPDQPPRPLPLVERERVIEGLISDRGHARFSDQPLDPQLSEPPSTEVSPPVLEPPPPPASPPEWLTAEWAMPEQPVEPLVSNQPPAPTVQSANPTGGGQRELLGVISFAGDSVTLGADGRQALQEIVAVHQARGGGLMVVGQAGGRLPASEDPLGHGLARLERSAERANQVAGELLALGVDSSQLQVAANADSRPVQDDPVSGGGAGDRRVEIYLVD